MVQDASELAALLAGGPLDSRPVYTIELSRSDETVMTVPVDAQDLTRQWTHARSLLADTGRWPIAAGMFWSRPRLPPSRETFWLDPRDQRPHPATTIAAAKELDGQRALEEIWRARRNWDWRDRLDWQLEATRKRCGSAPEPQTVLDALTDQRRARYRWSGPVGSPSELELEFFLLEWEEQHTPTRSPENPDRDDWFTRAPAPHLLFLPTRHGPETLAYQTIYAADDGVRGATYERLIAILTTWETRYGAELVANWGTMLQFTVSRPPDTLQQAWELAVDIDLIGPNSGPEPHQRDNARYLWRRPTWFVHCRP
jgi:hypothetical protein